MIDIPFLSKQLIGYELQVNPFIPKEALRQFRFPRSKKKRIRKKWYMDKKRNWRMMPTVWLFAGRDDYRMGMAVCHPDLFDDLKARFTMRRGIINGVIEGER